MHKRHQIMDKCWLNFPFVTSLDKIKLFCYVKRSSRRLAGGQWLVSNRYCGFLGITSLNNLILLCYTFTHVRTPTQTHPQTRVKQCLPYLDSLIPQRNKPWNKKSNHYSTRIQLAWSSVWFYGNNNRGSGGGWSPDIHVILICFHTFPYKRWLLSPSYWIYLTHRSFSGGTETTIVSNLQIP